MGSCSLPPALYQGMQRHGLVWLEDSLENRKQRILRDYVIDLGAEFVAAHGPSRARPCSRNACARAWTTSPGDWAASAKRLAAIMDEALRGQALGLGVAGHLGWIEGLLSEYYDPMYVYQRQQKPRASCSRGPGGGDAVPGATGRGAGTDDAPPHPGRPASRARDQAAWSDERTSSTGTGALRRMFSALLPSTRRLTPAGRACRSR